VSDVLHIDLTVLLHTPERVGLVVRVLVERQLVKYFNEAPLRAHLADLPLALGLLELGLHFVESRSRILGSGGTEALVELFLGLQFAFNKFGLVWSRLFLLR